jgi:sugar lactone lactonase YvrE
LAADSTGLYFVRSQYSLPAVIRRLNPDGSLVTLAGGGVPPDGVGDGGPATFARLYPAGLDRDANGNLFIADSENNRIRKIGPNGIITTVAGTGHRGFSKDGIAAIRADLWQPGDVAADRFGNLYVSDLYRLRKISPNGLITTVAGTGERATSPDGRPAAQTAITDAASPVADAAGNVYFIETAFVNNGYHPRVRKVGADGILTTVAGSGEQGYYRGEGIATQLPLWRPTDLALDSGGNLYIADEDRVLKVTPDGKSRVVAGGGIAINDGQPALGATICPVDLAVSAAGQVYFGEPGGPFGRVRRIEAGGTLSTVAGTVSLGYTAKEGVIPAPWGDGGAATAAWLGDPNGVALDAQGRLYILANHRLRRINGDGTIETLAGTGEAGDSGDGGPAIQARIRTVGGGSSGIAFDGAGNLYFTDSGNHRVRKITSDGIITTVAGTAPTAFGPFGEPLGGFSGDGGPARQAALNAPSDLVADGAGALYIADRGNFRIRKVSPDGITTFAGIGPTGRDLAGRPIGSFNGDGIPATQASLTDPVSLARDEAGNLFISDGLRIRKVDAQGIISTYAGNGTTGFEEENVPATAASVHPHSLALDATGNLYFANLRVDNPQIMKVTPDGLLLRVAGPSVSQRPGNVNGDDRLNIQDVTLALRAAVGLLSLPPRWLEAADLDGNGQVTIRDVIRIMKVVTGPA